MMELVDIRDFLWPLMKSSEGLKKSLGESPREFDSPCHHQSRHDLPPALQASIHEEAIAAFRDGKNDDANPYPKGCAAFLQWEHSYDEYKEACDAQDANDFA